MKCRRRVVLLGVFSIALIILFIFTGISKGNYDYVLPRRLLKVLAISLTAGSIAFSSMIFQTIANNRILTPSVLGLDSLYMFIQTFVVFILGANNRAVMNSNFNFLISISLMVVFSMILYRFLFKREDKNIFFLLLTGLIFGTLFQSLAAFMQTIIDPNAFLVIQDKMFASFNKVNTDVLLISIIGILLVLAYVYDYVKVLDVMLLGREQAINLGVSYDKVVKKMLIVVSILVSISTALVGPITFLGLLSVNLTYEFINSYKHKYLIVGSVFISIIALVGGQFLVERFLNFGTTLSVIINFIGGIYFMYLLLKESKL
ncbi:TPA: iron chelate uptake ABC transporter family permease subunit [Clostridium botulinum]|uniref:iron chelate uptake ABC transporter family permease subunit n=1 Tax=Clostridium botulinum TaxID=1491 RepID=UPI000D0CD9C7|nr:iron chelate uptake ABC transporter family permease subunit [Clostridium botulinum]PSM03110.1 iron ABC transporter permease [Clostridium botulinum]HDK7137551.1 iron chelate uptake ABC transporter family permease subunit [Clostridium botulinum]HDK7142687.1 iron chelate uptake ABC transporter family permease subunit [Clostridium botulinum]HDK7146097.1 iron chelate uptake ABC transporter family permease subunit [Clostridium botulinum]HDK7149803.1 iron chelate uptake ABC transporter family perm